LVERFRKQNVSGAVVLERTHRGQLRNIFVSPERSVTFGEIDPSAASDLESSRLRERLERRRHGSTTQSVIRLSPVMMPR
jgi:hypothetical protein